jgi:hypothetical protein
MLLVAYMQKQDGLIKRAGSNETFIVEPGHIPLLQAQDEEEDEYSQQMEEVNSNKTSTSTL